MKSKKTKQHMYKLKLAQLIVLPRFVLEDRRHYFRKNAEKIVQVASNKTKGHLNNSSNCSSAVLKNHVGT